MTYCFCPHCGEPDENWEFIEGITHGCRACGERFEDVNAAWWYMTTQEEFWSLYFDAFGG